MIFTTINFIYFLFGLSFDQWLRTRKNDFDNELVGRPALEGYGFLAISALESNSNANFDTCEVGSA